ncbi:MAG: aldehyde ferredoxin oxidoreductase C-terminal domain-containing protein [Ancalomicrobiaceae bacterium]|nr:aldehyde ferredoxin oxidoreductase C-terminal domain-containing protein [Ancalomicrobiaceae bacterium]
MDKILRVNMTNLTVKVEPVPADWAGLGGRALTSTIVAAEVPPTCHPLGPNNKLVFAPGLLSGTAASNANRFSCGSKSPLTGGIKECSAGGTSSRIIARLGYKAIVVEGKPAGDTWYTVVVDKDGATIKPETEVLRLGTFATVQHVNEHYGEDFGVITLGPAGENLMAIANISVKDPESKIRSFGRGGLGAVMGSKKIKMIVINPEGGVALPLADPAKFKAANQAFTKTLLDHPVSGQGLKKYGTAVLVNVLNEAGGLPTKNFTSGQCAHHDAISGETMYDNIVARGGEPSHNCSPSCQIQCSQIYNDKDGNYVTSGFEYETIWALGADGMVEDLDVIAEIDNVFDDIGVDSIETPVMFAVAMEAGLIPWGDGKRILELLRNDITNATPLGRMLGGGTGHVGRAFGMTRIPVVKNQAIPAYDPRPIKGIGVTYATTTMGADHTAGYAIATNILNVGGKVDPLSNDGQVELSRNLQIATAAIDSTGLCLFIAFPALDIPACLGGVIDMLNARYGINLTGDDVIGLGKQVLKIEHAFNLAAGLGPETDRLPEFFELESIAPHNVKWDMDQKELASFWNF